MIRPPKQIRTTGAGTVMSLEEYAVYRTTVYEYYFYNDKKWTFEGQSVFFGGQSIHYSDFMKAKRGSL